MSMSKQPSPALLGLFVAFLFFHHSSADIGTASPYGPPYLPTACYGNEASQFPSSNLFGAGSEVIWDNGTACGIQYLVRCISGAVPGTCISEQTIMVRIVDRLPSNNGATIGLSTTAFGSIANSSATLMNIEYRQF